MVYLVVTTGSFLISRLFTSGEIEVRTVGDGANICVGVGIEGMNGVRVLFVSRSFMASKNAIKKISIKIKINLFFFTSFSSLILPI